MEKMEYKAYAKINLGLDVVRRREDGYHEVKMIMQTVGIYDTLTFQLLSEDVIRLSANEDTIPTDESNLIYKAVKLIKDTYGVKMGLDIHLVKRIPVAAGMAGGSTDCAGALIAANELFGLGLTREELMNLGVKLGADVPYCIMQGTALSEGIGEILTPLLPMPDCFILVAKPPVSVSTKFVYENLHANELTEHPDIDGMVKAIDRNDLKGIVSRMENVLETVTIPHHPEIGDIKDIMVDGGAMGALMSGSGPTVFGIFSEEEKAKAAAKQIAEKDLANQIFVVKPVNP